MPNLEANKNNVRAFYEMMFNSCEPRRAIETYAGDTYIQHNPHVGDGKEEFISCFERMAANYPGKRVEIKRTFAEGDHVILHCHQIWPEGLEYAKRNRPNRPASLELRNGSAQQALTAIVFKETNRNRLST